MSYDALGAYMRDLRKVKLLKRSDEIVLAKRYLAGDKEAGEQLAKSCLRMAINEAMRYRHCIDTEDLIGAANEGVAIALTRFDPDRGCRFSTYAMWWVRSCVCRAAIDGRSFVKLGSGPDTSTVFHHLKQVEARLQAQGLEVTDKTVAVELGVKEGSVTRVRGRLKHDLSLDETIYEAPLTTKKTFLDLLGTNRNVEDDIADEMDYASKVAAVRAALANLDDRARKIIEQRFLSGKNSQTLQQLGDALGITRERVRQVQKQALDAMCKMIKKEALR